MKKTMLPAFVLISLAYASLSIAQQATPSPQPQPKAAKPSEPQAMSFDCKDLDIRDVIRTISTGYNLSIVMDPTISGKVTVHFVDVPVIEGLSQIVGQLNLEIAKEGNVYQVRKKTDEQHSVIQYIRGKLTVDVQNNDVRDFLKELSSKTAISIVPDAKVNGKISGKLFEVNLEDGLRALLEGNGFDVTKRKNIYNVTVGGESNPSMPMQPRRPGSPNGRSAFNVEYSDGKITVDVSNGDLEDVVKAIAEQSGIQIVTYGSLRAEINAKLDNIPLTEALALLLGGTNYTFIQKDSIILIGDRNPMSQSGQALSKSELIHLKHIKADIVPQILPKNIQVQNVKVIKEQNALLVTGTSEDIVNTREFLNTIDVPTPQVVMDVLVVEFSRQLDRNFGMSFGTNSKEAHYGFSYPYLSLNLNKAGAVGVFKELSSSLVRLPSDFFLKLNLMESQDKAKVLAQPSITVLNGNKASIDVSTTEYYKIQTTTDNTTNLQFRPITFGITLQITPWISEGGQITVEVAPDISNSIGKTEGDQGGYPSVFKRSASTTVRLNNDQTLVLGGLIRSDVHNSQSKVPILGDIPILGNLFRTSHKNNQQTNLVIFITPHIVKDSASINLGKELEKMDRDQQKIFMKDESFSSTYKKSRYQISPPDSVLGDTGKIITEKDSSQSPTLLDADSVAAPAK
jgi:type IV pilus assembly protein PilQ